MIGFPSVNIYLLNMQVRIKQYSDIECFTTTFLRAHSWLNWVGSHEQRDLINFTNPISQLKQLTIKDFANYLIASETT